MVVANFCNNNKFTSELVSVSVSKISRKLERIERECLLINFTTRELVKSVPLRAMESL
jgi:hypothetical protein